MNRRMIRGIVLSTFTLLVYVALSAPAYAAYVQIADLTVWNNANSNTSGAHITVQYDAAARLVLVTLLGDPTGAPPGSAPENDIDQFYWNGTAILTLVGWAGSPSSNVEANNGGHADGFCCFAKEITSTRNGTGTNGFDARVLLFTTDGGTFLPCFAAHVIEERSGANAYVSGTCGVTTPEPASLLLLGPGLLFLGIARRRLSTWRG